MLLLRLLSAYLANTVIYPLDRLLYSPSQTGGPWVCFHSRNTPSLLTQESRAVGLFVCEVFHLRPFGNTHMLHIYLANMESSYSLHRIQ